MKRESRTAMRETRKHRSTTQFLSSSSHSPLLLQLSRLTILVFLLNTINPSADVSSSLFYHSDFHYLPAGYLSIALFSSPLPTPNGLVIAEYNLAEFAATSDTRTCSLTAVSTWYVADLSILHYSLSQRLVGRSLLS